MKTEKHWEPVGIRNHHGIALPLSALRTKKSCGIGEFLDLIPLIDWCALNGLDVIQFLPLNDRGDGDSSPYNAISSCALDPVYLSLRDLPEAHDTSGFIPLNELDRVDHPELKKRKREWLHQYFLLHFDPNEAGYKTFVDENSDWLHSYALFKAFKEEYNQKAWKDWPEEPEIVNAKIEFYYFLQYLCFQQMRKVKNYATSRKVFLLGDIPILINPDSVDVWAEPEFFDLSCEAGAPPDRFNPGGQHWGFPIFNWNIIREDHFSWWKRRLRVIGSIFHLYRIDHVVGFFRMWAFHNSKGDFVPMDQNLWPGLGREILEMMLDSSPLLPIAEDLGGKVKGIDTLADVVRPMLAELGICGTKVLRWERRWNTDRKFIPYNSFEPFSLSTVSTHDTETVQIWWKTHPKEALDYAHFKRWNYSPRLTLNQRTEILRDSHHTPSYFHVNLFQEYLSLFPELSWPKPEDERINTPGTFSPKNWTYRLKPYLEEILEHKGLSTLIAQLIK